MGSSSNNVLLIVFLVNVVLQIVYGVVLTKAVTWKSNLVFDMHLYLQPCCLLVGVLFVWLLGERFRLLTSKPISHYFQEDDHFALVNLAKGVSLFVLFLQTYDFLPRCPVTTAAELQCVQYLVGAPQTFYSEVELNCERIDISQFRRPELSSLLMPDPVQCPPDVFTKLCSCDDYDKWLALTFWEVITAFLLIIMHNEKPSTKLIALRAFIDNVGPWFWLHVLLLETEGRILPIGVMTVCFFATLYNVGNLIGSFAHKRHQRGEGYTKRELPDQSADFEMSSPSSEESKTDDGKPPTQAVFVAKS